MICPSWSRSGPGASSRASSGRIGSALGSAALLGTRGAVEQRQPSRLVDQRPALRRAGARRTCRRRSDPARRSAWSRTSKLLFSASLTASRDEPVRRQVVAHASCLSRATASSISGSDDDQRRLEPDRRPDPVALTTSRCSSSARRASSGALTPGTRSTATISPRPRTVADVRQRREPCRQALAELPAHPRATPGPSRSRAPPAPPSRRAGRRRRSSRGRRC